MENNGNPNYHLNRRLKASFFDAGCFALIALILNFVCSAILTHTGSKYNEYYETITAHIEYSNLCKVDKNSGYLSYTTEELKSAENDTIKFVSILSYYYLNYLSNSNITDGHEGSKNIQNYTIKWFNEEILETGKKDFFIAKDGSSNLENEIAIVNKDFFLQNGTTQFENFLELKYQEAVEHFYNLSFIKAANDYMNFYNSLVMLLSFGISLIIVYLFIPYIKNTSQTLGKRIFKILVIKDDEIAGRFTMLLRILPAFLVVIFVSFIGEIYWQIGVPILFLLISSGLMIFTKSNKSVHDYVANTKTITVEKFMEIKHEDK